MIFHRADRALKSSAKSSTGDNSHYDAGGAPVRDLASSGINPDSTGMNRGSILDDRDKPWKTGAPREITGKNRQRPARNREQPGRHRKNRDGTSYGNSQVNAVRVPQTGALPERHRHSPGLRRGITGDDRGETGVLPHGECRRCYGIPGRCRLSPGLNQGTTGDNRGYAGTLLAFTGALSSITGASPG
ncbi:hypothetical protein DPMN_116707 [Dreissena polymorpha]|uniref:Uncharacterized protein n=1 Tax=Dreissena polymorpha TaxID=45954 RepID=A0A9D4QTM9_DREPO|nr:hypothetical protein DPMN_116707 [Dreissena polymorpha]